MIYNFLPETIEFAKKAESFCSPLFASIDRVCEYNTAKMLGAFSENRVAERHFAPSAGYGYDDAGRDNLDRVFASAFGCEDALVRPNFINGTHALSVMLQALLSCGDTALSVTGKPYDTLAVSVELLRSRGVKFVEEGGLPAVLDGGYLDAIREKCAVMRPKLVYVQRSRGYGDRIALSARDIKAISAAAKSGYPEVIVAVDNCYGEFCEYEEPCTVSSCAESEDSVFHFGGRESALVACDIMAGSLIKNPGGGLAPCGGYVAGKSEFVELCAETLSVPGIGREAGANPFGWRSFYQGFFMAPHIVAQALKTAVFAAELLGLAGYEVSPRGDEKRSDIIQTIKFGKPEPIISFCRGIQAASAVDSFVVPEAWDMPGYSDKVIMAAGAFVQGSSIELSADAPLREPYILYLQGGLTYESGKLGIMRALDMAKREE